MHLFRKPLGVAVDIHLASGDQAVERCEARLRIVAQAARIVVEDVADQRALLAQLQQLVHLLLVFHQAKAHFGVVEREHAFGPHGVLVQRNRNRAQ
ncbi:hypothetical protein D3C72_1823580 [compost metagenome]